MTLKMPEPRQETLDQRAMIVEALRAIVPGEGVIETHEQMRAYETDGLTAYRQPPMVVVLPETAGQVAEVLRFCFEHQVKVVPRGAGTSLSGGALPLADGVLLGLGKFNRILDIDYDSSGTRGAESSCGARAAGDLHCRSCPARHHAPTTTGYLHPRRRLRSKGAFPNMSTPSRAFSLSRMQG